MDETGSPLSVEEAAEEAILFSRVLCPFYDSEPESPESETDSSLSILSDADDDDYHSLPPSPMASPLHESDPSRDFSDRCLMNTDASICDESESERNPYLVDWIETETASSFSSEAVSEQGDGMDAVWDPLVSVDTNELHMSSLQVDSNNLPEIARILELDGADANLGLAETVELSTFEDMDTDASLLAGPYSPDTQYVLDNLDAFNECFPPNPNDAEPEPDWEAGSAVSSVPDLEEMVRNMEVEVLLAMHNIYEGDPEMDFFRQLLELDRGVRWGPAASKSAVESLPNITADESMVDLECAVCKELVLVGESLKRLPCSHDYHANCILPWLGIRNTCPLCRFELPTDDQNYESWRSRQENQD
jgi:Ring finger domain